MSTFEELFTMCQSLPEAGDDTQRLVEWVGAAARLGLARQATGAIEVFIKGDRLAPKSALVERHLRHDNWIAVPGSSFRANRIVFPSESHFVAVAAFVAEQLLRHGVDSVPQTAFEIAEPVIEMALRGTAMIEDAQLGLFGELYVLKELLRSGTSTAAQAKCIEAWRGYEHSSRDFVFPGRIDVEVKTTRRVDSTHPISRLAQIDPSRTGTGIPIEQLYLVSLGITHDDAQGQTLPDLVEAVLELLGADTTPARRNAIQNLFLSLVARYGSSGRGYIHDEMRNWSAYSSLWSIRWERTYNMNDESFGVLRRHNVAELPHIDPESIRLTVKLPTEPISAGNPAQGLEALVRQLVGEAGSVARE